MCSIVKRKGHTRKRRGLLLLEEEAVFIRDSVTNEDAPPNAY